VLEEAKEGEVDGNLIRDIRDSPSLLLLLLCVSIAATDLKSTTFAAALDGILPLPTPLPNMNPPPAPRSNQCPTLTFYFFGYRLLLLRLLFRFSILCIFSFYTIKIIKKHASAHFAYLDDCFWWFFDEI
jgi:hypothetical protein